MAESGSTSPALRSFSLATEQAIRWILANPAATLEQLRELLAIMRTANRRETRERLLMRLREARWYHAGGDSPEDLLSRAKVEAIIRQEMDRL